MRLSEVATRLHAQVIRDAEFGNLGFLFDDLPDKLIFVEDRRFVAAARAARGAACVLCLPELASEFPDSPGLAVSAEPRQAFFELQQFLSDDTDFYWATFASEISASARIHPRAVIAERNVRIGPETIVEANAVVGERTLIGARAHLRAGAVLGTEGFQHARLANGILQMRHAGGLIVADGVQIFANATIARGVFRQMTSLGDYSWIGNGAFVSHNVQVGKLCIIGHNSTINGNTTIGDEVWIGPGATVSNLLQIGERAHISLGATVIRSVPPDARVTGMPALEHRRMLRHAASLR